MIEWIASPKRTKEILTNYRFVFKKKYGQNFLIDLHVLNKIIRAADITKDDVVIEVGPGIGSLTQMLAEKAKHVIAIEIDKNLIKILEDTLSEYDNITLIQGDVLKADFKTLIQEYNDSKPIKFVANLPYYITTPIIMGLLENEVPIYSMTVMVQKEVAQRMQSEPGIKSYGALTLAIKYYTNPYIVAYVPPNCFMPRPNVSSAVINLTKHEKPVVLVKDEKLMFNIIRATFNQRRKTLVKSVSQQLSIDKKKIIEALESIQISVNIRGEMLTIQQFAMLSDKIFQIPKKDV